MPNVKSILKFIRKHELKSKQTYAALAASAQRQGYEIFEWQRNLPKHEEILDKIDCLNLSRYKDGFTYVDQNKKIIFVLKTVSEAEKKILLTHELIHLHLGHIKPFEVITVAEENAATEFAHSLKLILGFIRFLKYTLPLLILIAVCLFGRSSIHTSVTSPNQQYVYVTRSGDCYHRKHCGTIQSSKTVYKINIQDAMRAYFPCSVCNPDLKE